MSKKTKKTPLTPPTILTVTLNAAGGSLIARRGDLATISQFTFHSMTDLFTAIQTGAATLMQVEKDPPPKDFGLSQPAPATVPAAPDETTVTETDEAGEPAEPVEEDAPASAEALPTADLGQATGAIQPPVAASPTNQLNLW
jgi:hypothetical protein